jgi:hypothetical protein
MKKSCMTIITMCSITLHSSAAVFMPALNNVRKKVESAQAEAVPFSEYFKKEKTTIAGFTHDLFEQIRHSFFWASQEDFVREIENAQQQSSAQAAMLIKEKIKLKYADTPMPLIFFAKDLEREEKELKDLIPKILNKAEHRQELLINHAKLAATLQKIIGFTNTVLLS